MSAWEGPTGELATLLSTLSDGRLSHAQYERLTQIISTDREARKLYLRWIYLEARLQRQFGVLGAQPRPQDDAASILMEVLEEEQRLKAQRAVTEAERQLQDSCAVHDEESMGFELLYVPPAQVVPVRHIVIPKWLVYGAAAGLVAMILFFVTIHGMRHDAGVHRVAPETPVAAAQPLAHFRGGVEVQWVDESGRSTPLRADAPMHRGTWTLKGGVAELRMTSGARLILESPARLVLLEKDEVELQQGKVVVHCPVEARGFRVTTPEAYMMDLGTEFAVSVNGDDGTEVYVFDGQVTLSTKPLENMQDGTLLDVGWGGHVRPNGRMQVDVVRRPTGFLRSIPSAYTWAVRRSQPRVFLTFDDPSTPNNNVMGDPEFDAMTFGNVRVTGEALDGGGAVYFDGADNQFVQFRSPTVPGRQVAAQTIVLWVKPQRISTQSVIMRTGARGADDLCATRLGITEAGRASFYEFTSLDGVVARGRPQTGIGHSLIQTEQWVHLALVSQDYQPPLLYVNGRIEAIGEPNARLPRNMDRFHIGSGSLRKSGPFGAEPFQGWVDDVALYDRALDESEIHALYSTSNRSQVRY